MALRSRHGPFQRRKAQGEPRCLAPERTRSALPADTAFPTALLNFPAIPVKKNQPNI